MINIFVFSQTQGRLISQDVSIDLLKVLMQDEGLQFWVDANDVSDEEARQLLDEVFHFHSLSIEDCITPSDRPKVEEYNGYLFMILHAVDYSASEFRTTELNLFIGKNFLVTFHRDPLRSVTATIERVKKNASAVARAPDRLTYTILDLLLENYSPAMEQLNTDISNIEESVLRDPNLEILPRVMQLKSQVTTLRQIVGPQRDVLSRLAHGEFKIVRPSMLPYYRDLLDQLVRISTQADNYREALTSTLQVHLNLQQNQINRVIKVLTIMATLAMPILAVTSFYGMNVQHWPSISHSLVFSYIWVLGLSGALTGLTYWIMKRKGWY